MTKAESKYFSTAKRTAHAGLPAVFLLWFDYMLSGTWLFMRA